MKKYLIAIVTASLAMLLALFAPAPRARADIFQWEYINPADPSLGKQPSTMLTPDGAGANAAPGTNLSNRNLTKAYLIGANVSTYLVYDPNYGYVDSHVASNLTGVTLSQADLTNANFGGANGYNWSEEFTYYPGADLTDANLSHANARNANFFLATLTGANLSGANLTDANFIGTTLTGADLTGAEVRWANFNGNNSISLAQLYSTASYQAHDLTGIGFVGNNLSGVNLVGQNLTDATFFGATLTGADLTGAEVRGADFGYTGLTAAQLYSTASYQAHELSGMRLPGIDLTGVNLAGQNLSSTQLGFATLTNASFSLANLTDANLFGAALTDADLTGTNLMGANFSGFYGEWNYYGDLTGANLSGADARGANFQDATLTGASLSGTDARGANFFAATLTGANLSGTDARGANFFAATLTGANLSGADARGANFQSATLTGAYTSNLIQSNGHIAGLALTAGTALVVRDYDGNPAAYPPVGPLPIVVEQHLAMDASGTLRLVFDADPWNSTISFAPGIPVALAGTLELVFAPGVELAGQFGRTIDLFDWTGVSPSGAFTLSSPYAWNLSKLYTTGEVTLTTTLAGDVNLDGAVDIFDVNAVSTYWGTSGPQGDANGDGTVDIFDVNLISSNWTLPGGGSTAVPEPTAWILALLAALAWIAPTRRALWHGRPSRACRPR